MAAFERASERASERANLRLLGPLLFVIYLVGYSMSCDSMAGGISAIKCAAGALCNAVQAVSLRYPIVG